MNQLDFKNRHCIVTGGAQGIGFAITARIVESGGKVAIWDKAPHFIDDAVTTFGGTRVVGFETDVADEASVARAMEMTIAAFPKVDVMICSAGITGPNLRVHDYPLEEWRQVMSINLNGVFLCNKAVVPHMQKHNYGRIVNIASIAGKEGNPNAAAYSASKAGVISLTKSLGKELADTNIRVNCVTPAAVRTGMFSQMTDEHIQFMLSKIPMKRFGLVEEIAALVCWMATDECSFTTGAVFDLSGGRATY